MIGFLLLLTFLALLMVGVWWGSNVVFYPPKLLATLARPEEFGLAYENIEFPTPDGVRLRGWFIKAAAPTERTVIMCHGWGDNKGDVLARLHPLQRSFNLFLFDSRAHGESAGNISTIGCLESLDFEAALNALKERKPSWNRLGLFGISMGAALAIFGMARHSEVRCAVLESPFRSFNSVVRQFAWNNYRLPYIPFVWLTLLVVRLRLGQDPEPFSPLYHVAKLSPRPILVIAGDKDGLMPLTEVQKLYARAGQNKEIWVIAGASHGKCQEIAGAQYDRRIQEFFAKYL